jgi:hypothetical protein
MIVLYNILKQIHFCYFDSFIVVFAFFCLFFHRLTYLFEIFKELANLYAKDKQAPFSDEYTKKNLFLAFRVN